MKVIPEQIIESCDKCTFEEVQRCMHLKSDAKIIPHFPNIPKWCPLKDYVPKP